MAAVYASKYSLVPKGAQDFYLNRALRLYPTYFILTILTAVYYFADGSDASDVAQHHLFDLFVKADDVPSSVLSTVWLSIATLVGQDFLSVHEPYHFMLPVRQSWSIGSELLFYATVPLLYRHATLKRCLIGFVILMLVKLGLLTAFDWRATYFIPIGNFGYFLLGYGAYMISVHPTVEKLKAHNSIMQKRGVLVLMLLMLTFFGEASFERSGPLHHFALVGGFTVGCILLFERTVSKLDLLLGNLAYGIYLNHFLLIVALTQIIDAAIPKTEFVLWLIAASCCLALLMEKLIQRPIDRWRRARTDFLQAN